MYRTMNDGSLVSIGSGYISTGTTPRAVKVHPSGKYVYVCNGDSDNISMYSVNSDDGTLANLTPSTISSNGAYPNRMAIDPVGNYLFVVNVDGENIVAFSIDNTTGQLSLISSFHNIIDRAITSDIQDVAVDFNGRLYICCSSGIFFYNWPVYLTFESNFILQAPPANNRYLELHPSGKYLYLISGVKDVTAYQVSSDGTLSSSPVSQLLEVGGFGGYVYDILVHPSGNYIYLPDWGNNYIYYLTINSDGSLTVGPTNLRRNAYGLAIFRKKVK